MSSSDNRIRVHQSLSSRKENDVQLRGIYNTWESESKNTRKFSGAIRSERYQIEETKNMTH